MDAAATPLIAIAMHIGLQALFVVRALIRPNREPASRLAWVVVILVAPVVGMIAYMLVGETNIGRGRIERMRAVAERLPDAGQVGGARARVPAAHEALFRLGESVNGYRPVGGNIGRLLADADATIDALVADIDAAEDHVHVLFYIWLADNNGLKVVAALRRAAKRGVRCRVLADALGSRLIIGSSHWSEMLDDGVVAVPALPIGLPVLPRIWGRIDMRNHRKIVVIDNDITYCGSQNCADAAFAIKPKYAPWIDIMLRFEGPVARQNQHLFATDWMAHVEEDLSPLLSLKPKVNAGGFPAQVIATGATVRASAMPEVFASVIMAAKNELRIVTPYYVPDESIQSALCATARRGVKTRVIFPRRNDSWIVAAASRSYYEELLAAGVNIHEFDGGLLHAKLVIVDDALALIGSANIDRRSFDLNFENNMLISDEQLVASLAKRWQIYVDESLRIGVDDTSRWSWRRRLWNNGIATLGPVL